VRKRPVNAKDKAAAAADAAAAAAAAHNDTAEAAADQQAIIDAAIAAGNTIVQLPEDFSEAHRKLIRHGRKETRQSIQAARHVAVVLTDKDETIRSLVANITWMTVNMGKLADKVDLQSKYISLLREKLHIAKALNRRLRRHAADARSTNEDIRSQLKSIKSRLAAQDRKHQDVNEYLEKNVDKVKLPSLGPEMEIVGPRLHHRRRKFAARLRPVPGTQTYAAHFSPYIYPASPVFIPSSAPSVHVVDRPFAHPFEGPLGNIPTIIVERPDNGA